MKDLHVHITFIEEVLGSMPSDKQIYENFIASNAPDAKSRAEELETVSKDDYVDKTMTVFPHDEDDNAFAYDYQIKGFFKDSIGFLRKVSDTKSSKIKAYKKLVDGNIFPYPRKIRFLPAEGKKYVELGTCQRPLRASTPQGEREALAMSETVPAGTQMDFHIVCMTPEALAAVRECLDYGIFHGFSQWRNSGKGRFEWEEVECTEFSNADMREKFRTEISK